MLCLLNIPRRLTQVGHRNENKTKIEKIYVGFEEFKRGKRGET